MALTPTVLGDRADGIYVENVQFTLQASTTQTASTNGAGFDLGSYGTARLDLNVTAASGTTPSMTVAVQTSPDNVNWTTIASFTAATGVVQQHQVFAGCDRYLRAATTITGTTPSFTFAVTGSAV